jgi:hypothetical protein
MLLHLEGTIVEVGSDHLVVGTPREPRIPRGQLRVGRPVVGEPTAG